MKWIVTHVDDLENFACEFETETDPPSDEEIIAAIRDAGLQPYASLMVATDEDDMIVVYDAGTDEDIYYVEPDENYE